ANGALKGAFASAGSCARAIDDIAKVLAGIDAGEHDIGWMVAQEVGHASNDAIGGGAADDGEGAGAALVEGEFVTEGKAVPCPGLVAIGRDDPDIVAEAICDVRHDGDAWRIHAIVIGDEDAQGHYFPPMEVRPPM